jgi:hypothetical protein
MAKAKRKSTTPAPLPREQPYNEPEDIRRPPYFGEREPVVWAAEVHERLKITVCADARRSHSVDLDVVVPSGEEWLRVAAERLRASSDCPYQVTEAAQQLESAMHEAFIRRQCDERWGSGGIKNKLRDWGLWPRRRRPHRPR